MDEEAPSGGGNGGDSLSGTPDGDGLDGGNGDDTLDGGWGSDTLVGGNGDDRLVGGPGQPSPFEPVFEDDDVLLGGNGGDDLSGGWASDSLHGGNGDDTLNGGWGDDTLGGGNGDDSLVGGPNGLVVFSDDDVLRGGNGDDTLRGVTGDDTLHGGNGDDVLDPNSGFDVLYGGDGADTFVFGFGAPLTPGILIDRGDVIMDFQQGSDVLDLRALNRMNFPMDLEFAFIGDAPFSGSGVPEARAFVSGGETVVELDTQFGSFIAPDGRADGSFRIAGEFRLEADDFLL